MRHDEYMQQIIKINLRYVIVDNMEERRENLWKAWKGIKIRPFQGSGGSIFIQILHLMRTHVNVFGYEQDFA